MGKAKFFIEAGGRKYTKPEWIDSENVPFQNPDDAREWGDEIICQIEETGFHIVGLEANYREFRWWEKMPGGYEEARQHIESKEPR